MIVAGCEETASSNDGWARIRCRAHAVYGGRRAAKWGQHRFMWPVNNGLHSRSACDLPNQFQFSSLLFYSEDWLVLVRCAVPLCVVSKTGLASAFAAMLVQSGSFSWVSLTSGVG